MKRFLIPLIVVWVLFGFCLNLYSAVCSSDSVYFDTLVGEEWRFTLANGEIHYLEFGTSFETCVASGNCSEFQSSDGCAYLHTQGRDYGLGRIFHKPQISQVGNPEDKAYVAEILHDQNVNNRRCYNFLFTNNSGSEATGTYYELDVSSNNFVANSDQSFNAIRIGADGGDEEACFINSLATINFMTIIKIIALLSVMVLFVLWRVVKE